MDISGLLNNPQELNKVFEKAIDEKDLGTINLLLPHIKNPKLIFKYAKDIVGGKVNDELEDIIIQDPFIAYDYAVEVLKDRFPKGEKVFIMECMGNMFETYLKILINKNKIDEFINDHSHQIKYLLLEYFHHLFETRKFNYPQYLDKIIESLPSSTPLKFYINYFIKEHPEWNNEIYTNLKDTKVGIFLPLISRNRIKEVEDKIIPSNLTSLKSFNEIDKNLILYIQILANIDENLLNSFFDDYPHLKTLIEEYGLTYEDLKVFFLFDYHEILRIINDLLEKN